MCTLILASLFAFDIRTAFFGMTQLYLRHHYNHAMNSSEQKDALFWKTWTTWYDLITCVPGWIQRGFGGWVGAGAQQKPSWTQNFIFTGNLDKFDNLGYRIYPKYIYPLYTLQKKKVSSFPIKILEYFLKLSMNIVCEISDYNMLWHGHENFNLARVIFATLTFF